MVRMARLGHKAIMQELPIAISLRGNAIAEIGDTTRAPSKLAPGVAEPIADMNVVHDRWIVHGLDPATNCGAPIRATASAVSATAVAPAARAARAKYDCARQ